MVAMTAGPRFRPARDPARPIGSWVPVLLVAAGIMLSLLGWATSDRLAALQSSAERSAVYGASQQWRAVQAEVRATTSANEAGALAALVVYRCDTGQITDPQTCEAARRLR